ncbi:MAG TPA: UDP-N-acetylglucosamine 2-epimerase (non-hydrolyzing) [Candidatus Limnocylindrales bacterium]
MRIVSVLGTRPQLIKAAALSPVLRERHAEIFVDTGQHYDEALAGSFFEELALPRPDHSLGVGGGSAADQTARMLVALEPILLAARPDAVLVYGDTNSTLAGALTAAKLGVPIAHVEAGLRSFDRSMPEEINRIVADHLATWLFAPTPTAVRNLGVEGIAAGVTLVGDLMQDLAGWTLPVVRDPAAIVGIGERLGFDGAPGRYLFATIHRAENRDPAAIGEWVRLLDAVARPDRPVVLAIHPGTRIALETQGSTLGPDVVVVEPQGYRTSLALQLHAAAVLTDSGGVQREAAWLGVPCLVLRHSTEWVEAATGPASRTVLVGRDVGTALVALEQLAPVATSSDDARDRAASVSIPPAGAAAAIVAALETGTPAGWPDGRAASTMPPAAPSEAEAAT